MPKLWCINIVTARKVRTIMSICLCTCQDGIGLRIAGVGIFPSQVGKNMYQIIYLTISQLHIFVPVQNGIGFRIAGILIFPFQVGKNIYQIIYLTIYLTIFVPVQNGIGLRIAGIGIFPSQVGKNINRFIIVSLSRNTSLLVIFLTAHRVS